MPPKAASEGGCGAGPDETTLGIAAADAASVDIAAADADCVDTDAAGPEALGSDDDDGDSEPDTSFCNAPEGPAADEHPATTATTSSTPPATLVDAGHFCRISRIAHAEHGRRVREP